MQFQDWVSSYYMVIKTLVSNAKKLPGLDNQYWMRSVPKVVLSFKEYTVADLAN